jgi:hypothetical protein
MVFLLLILNIIIAWRRWGKPVRGKLTG